MERSVRVWTTANTLMPLDRHKLPSRETAASEEDFVTNVVHAEFGKCFLYLGEADDIGRQGAVHVGLNADPVDGRQRPTSPNSELPKRSAQKAK